MRRVVLLPSARTDLLELRFWVEELSSPNLLRFANELQDKLNDLAVKAEWFSYHPHLGAPIRRRLHRQFVILYEIVEPDVLVHAIVRGSRDLVSLVRERQPRD